METKNNAANRPIQTVTEPQISSNALSQWSPHSGSDQRESQCESLGCHMNVNFGLALVGFKSEPSPYYGYALCLSFLNCKMGVT